MADRARITRVSVGGGGHWASIQRATASRSSGLPLNASPRPGQSAARAALGPASTMRRQPSANVTPVKSGSAAARATGGQEGHRARQPRVGLIESSPREQSGWRMCTPLQPQSVVCCAVRHGAQVCQRGKPGCALVSVSAAPSSHGRGAAGGPGKRLGWRHPRATALAARNGAHVARVDCTTPPPQRPPRRGVQVAGKHLDVLDVPPPWGRAAG
mmetsp:Transcript_5911/g.15050  ORF Transcript_5911/g.15050 Transcript_5911/m.15050 type:complete len:214 (-) Transcript_5911:173-814(-)